VNKKFIYISLILYFFSLNHSIAFYSVGNNSHSGDYLIANISINVNDYDTSLKFLKKIHGIDPYKQQTLEKLIFIETMNGDLSSANKYAEKILQLECVKNLYKRCQNDIEFQAKLVNGVHALSNKNPDDASNNFNNLSLKNLTQINFTRILDAWSWANKRDFNKSIKIIDSINSNDYQFITIFHKALIYDFVDEPELAEVYFDQSLVLNNEIYIINLYLSFLDRNNKIDKKKQIIEKYLSGYDQDFIQRLTKYNPQRIINNELDGISVALFNTHELLSGINDNQRFFVINLASTISDRFIENKFVLADTFISLSDYETALKIFKSIPADNYLAEITALKIVNIYSMSGNNQKAKNYLLNNDLLKNSFQGLMTLGNLFRYDSEWDTAIDTYMSAIEKKKNDSGFNLWDAYYKLGISYERKKDWKKAEEYLLKALHFSSFQPDVLNYLGYTYLDLDITHKFEDARKMLEEAVKQKPDDAYILDSMAWYYFKIGNFRDSLQLFEYAILIDPSDPTINDHYGDVLWKVGKFSQARYQWQKALDFNEDESISKRIKKKLILGI